MDRDPRSISSQMLRDYLDANALRDERLRAFMTMREALVQVHILLANQRGRFRHNVGHDSRVNWCKKNLESWLKSEWRPIVKSLGDLKGVIGLDGRAILELPLPSHRHEPTRRGVTALQDVLRPLSEGKVAATVVRAAASDLERFLNSDANAAGFFDQAVEWALHLLERLFEQLRDRAESLQLSDVEALARSLWMPATSVTVPTPEVSDPERKPQEVAAPSSSATSAPGEPPDQGAIRLAPDFTWLVVRGKSFHFTPGHQRKVIEVLFAAWEKSGGRDGHGLSESRLAEDVGSTSSKFRLRQTFGNHPALDTILRSPSKGTWALFLHSPEPPLARESHQNGTRIPPQ